VKKSAHCCHIKDLHTKGGHYHFGILLEAYPNHRVTHIKAFMVQKQLVLVIFS